MTEQEFHEKWDCREKEVEVVEYSLLDKISVYTSIFFIVYVLTRWIMSLF